jgi:hypothetical protein
MSSAVEQRRRRPAGRGRRCDPEGMHEGRRHRHRATAGNARADLVVAAAPAREAVGSQAPAEVSRVPTEKRERGPPGTLVKAPRQAPRGACSGACMEPSVCDVVCKAI